MSVPLHTTGKASFDDIYESPDPRAYFARMHELDYRIPELAKPHFEAELAELRALRPDRIPTVVDLGCSYGVNPALMRTNTGVADWAQHYRDLDDTDHVGMIAADRERLRADVLPDVRFIGMDAARPALIYAHAAGFLHDYVHADLEATEPTEAQRRVLATADLVISTGCVGYITEKTLSRVAQADPHKRPWMAHFVLRMFDFEPIAAELAALGYVTEKRAGLFEQRRFASAEEREQVLDALAAKGIDTTGHESEGWLLANLFISRPQST
ncbi:class I SAM-dependent methyltransferase [Nocardia camponoti]|uniref:Methyltransferase type 12 n=1 Tax=Nocardia camponoti TaxID=1616106 RepID=A0A917Q9P7_9NOCA|nr:class I SAM-dependent methyltransferase [Nocardia camponoti]GGK37734.1 methyltransferase type 12 [Nocardia camponoti]